MEKQFQFQLQIDDLNYEQKQYTVNDNTNDYSLFLKQTNKNNFLQQEQNYDFPREDFVNDFDLELENSGIRINFYNNNNNNNNNNNTDDNDKIHNHKNADANQKCNDSSNNNNSVESKNSCSDIDSEIEKEKEKLSNDMPHMENNCLPPFLTQSEENKSRKILKGNKRKNENKCRSDNNNDSCENSGDDNCCDVNDVSKISHDFEREKVGDNNSEKKNCKKKTNSSGFESEIQIKVPSYIESYFPELNKKTIEYKNNFPAPSSEIFSFKEKISQYQRKSYRDEARNLKPYPEIMCKTKEKVIIHGVIPILWQYNVGLIPPHAAFNRYFYPTTPTSFQIPIQCVAPIEIASRICDKKNCFLLILIIEYSIENKKSSEFLFSNPFKILPRPVKYYQISKDPKGALDIQFP